MGTKELILKKIENLPEECLKEVLAFVSALEKEISNEKLETAILSESSLEKDWLIPEEDEAWKDL
jgi:hypothetical protein